MPATACMWSSPRAPRRPARSSLDPGEEIAVETLPVDAVLAGLAEGLIGNAGHVGAILLALRAAGRIGF